MDDTETSAPPQPSRRELARGTFLDLVMLAGAGLLGYGAWLAYRPAGFMVLGVLLLAAGVNGSRR